MSPSRPKPPAYTVDTDVFVGGARAFRQAPETAEPVEARLLRRWLDGEWSWVVSDEVLDEYREVLLRRGAQPARVDRLIDLLFRQARVATPRPVDAPLPDPDDEHVIGTARAAGTAIITRNLDHYPPTLVRAITPEEAIAEIDAYLAHPMHRRRAPTRRRR